MSSEDYVVVYRDVDEEGRVTLSVFDEGEHVGSYLPTETALIGEEHGEFVIRQGFDDREEVAS